MKRALLAFAYFVLLSVAGRAYADAAQPPSYGIAAGWPGGPGQVMLQQIISPTLNALSLSPLTATVGSSYTGTISGDTAGSTLTLSNNDGGLFSLSGHTLTGSGFSAGAASIAVTETLTGATNTPKTTPFTITVSAMPSYSTNGVMFSSALSAMTTGSSPLATSAGTVADTSHFTYFAEVRWSGGNSTLWNESTTAETNILSSKLLSGDGAENLPGLGMLSDHTAGLYAQWRTNLGDSVADAHSDQSHSCIMPFFSSLPFYDGNWHRIELTGNLTSSGTTKDTVLYFDETMEAQNCQYAVGGPMLMGIAERPFTVRDFMQGQNSGGRIEFGDVFVDFATDAICMDSSTPIVRNGTSYACSAADTIPANLLKKFWNNGPVDLGSNGSNVFGRQPEIFLGHGATKSSWMTNLGSVTNLTTNGILYDAFYGPGATPTPHKAYVKWAKTDDKDPTTATSMVAQWGPETPPAGDLIVLIWYGIDTGGVDKGFGTICGTGFTLVEYAAPNSADGSSSTTCSKVSTGSEPTSYTSGTFVVVNRGLRWALLDIGQATGIRGHGQAAPTSCCNGGLSVLPSGQVTGAVAGDTILQIAGTYNNSGTGPGGTRNAVIVPDGGDVVLSAPITNQAGNSPQLTVTQEFQTSSGSTPVRTFTGTTGSPSGAAENDWSKITTLDIQPN